MARSISSPAVGLGDTVGTGDMLGEVGEGEASAALGLGVTVGDWPSAPVASAIEQTNKVTMKASRVLISVKDKSWRFAFRRQAHRCFCAAENAVIVDLDVHVRSVHVRQVRAEFEMMSL